MTIPVCAIRAADIQQICKLPSSLYKSFSFFVSGDNIKRNISPSFPSNCYHLPSAILQTCFNMWTPKSIGDIIATACAAGTACGIAAGLVYFHCETQRKKAAHEAERVAENNHIAGIIKAADFIWDKHGSQRRTARAFEPFVDHHVRVATILAEHGVQDTSAHQAAYLFGVVTDTPTSLDEVREAFGPKVAGIVEELSEDGDVPAHHRPQKMLGRANGLSRGARLVLLAHKIDTLKDMIVDTPERWYEFRVRNWCKSAEQVFHSLGKTHGGLEKTLSGVFRKVHHNTSPAVKEKAVVARNSALGA